MISTDDLRAAIAAVPDFPKPGILFRDITPLLAQPALLAAAVDAMAAPFRDARISHVLAIESRGFLLGAPLALSIGAALVPVRKPGKLPRPTRRAEYALEYGTDAIEMHEDAVPRDGRVLIVDDVLATGGTIGAAQALVEQSGAELAGATVLLELAALGGRARLPRLEVRSVLAY